MKLCVFANWNRAYPAHTQNETVPIHLVYETNLVYTEYTKWQFRLVSWEIQNKNKNNYKAAQMGSLCKTSSDQKILFMRSFNMIHW